MIHTSMFQKHIHRVKFYPSADDFTQALLVMLVTNIMSEQTLYRGYGKIYPDTAKAKKYQIVQPHKAEQKQKLKRKESQMNQHFQSPSV